MKRTTEGLRRYSRVTTKQIAKGTDLPEEEIKKALQGLLKDEFIHRCYDESGRLIPDLYEIPDSLPEAREWRGETGEHRGSRKWLLVKALFFICLGMAIVIGTCTFLIPE